LARPIGLAQELINSADLVRIPGCNGAAAAQLICRAKPADTTTNNDTQTTGDNGGKASDTYDIPGRLLDSVSSEPIANGYVVILKPEYKWSDVDYNKYVWVTAKTDANGEYTLSVTEAMANATVSYGLFAEHYDPWTSDEVSLLKVYDKEKNRWIDIYMDASK
jgi:hypothetical protein